MDGAVRIVDESPTGAILHELTLLLRGDRLTVRALIERRVRDEVERWNAGEGEHFHGLVEPTGAEAELNRPRTRRAIDAEVQIARALAAFEAGRVLVLVGDRQVEALDDELTLRPGVAVSFVKLVPLVGG